MKKILTLLLMAIMLTFPATASAEPTPGKFVDISGHWAEQDIKMVANLGVMIGTGTTAQGGGIFAPSSRVSRAQLAVVLQRTFQFDYGDIKFIKQPVASDYYRDVSNDTWYADALVMCAINQIFANAENFYPDRAVSRLEVAQAISRSFEAKDISIPMIMMMPVYEDTGGLTPEEMNAVVFVSNTGIMKGDAGFFRPEAELQRSELARILRRCISLTAIDENFTGQEYKVPAGQTFVIGLNSNPTTGYSWNLLNGGDAKILTKLADFYLSEADVNQFLVGQGGHQYWQFKALQPGATELQMVYARPWESVQPSQVFTLRVTVTPGNS